MSFDEHRLLKTLESVAAGDGLPRRFVVGFSGGLDSSTLLYALSKARTGRPVLALHVDHQLHADSGRWRKHAESVASDLGVDFSAVTAKVETDGGKGPEAAARDARYEAFRAVLRADDWLLLAQHRDDQAETLLLNLLRGSGPLGLAGMPVTRPFGEGKLVRPLLDVARQDLASFARDAGLTWLDDPSNDSVEFDRNFLRHEITPMLRQRWPDANARLARSAELAADAQSLLEELAAADLDSAGARPQRIQLHALLALNESRQRNLLRYACRIAGLAIPPAPRLDAILHSLLPAAADAEPMVAWPGAEARRYRDELFLLRAPMPDAVGVTGHLSPGQILDLGPGLGQLALTSTDGPGIPERLAEQGLEVVARQGGEALRIAEDGRSQKLKKLLQAEGILPWMRDCLPFLRHDDQLVAVADLWINADIATTPGYEVTWVGRPELT